MTGGKKKHRDPEYALHVFHQASAQSSRASVAFLVRTVKDFTSFNYEILLEMSIAERTIRLKILGLRTTPLLMPGTGPAWGVREFENLTGPYTLLVVKPDGDTNEYQLDISPSRITLHGSPAKPFISVTDERVQLPRL